MTIDVMFPYYGDVAMMKAAVASVQAQTYRDFRLVIVDDGYPDPELPAWFAALTAGDERVEYHRNETNLGANGNYRKCVQLVTAPFCVIMGADDVMLPNYLQTVADAFAADDVDIVQPGVEVIDENGAVYEPLGDRVKTVVRTRAVGRATRAVIGGEPLAASLISANWLYFPSVAWRSERVKHHNFRQAYDVVQDLALALDIIMAGGTMLVTDTVCFQYRRHRESDSSVRALDGRRFAEERAFFDECARDFTRLGWTGAARAARVHFSSRLHAVALAPEVVKRRMWPGLGKLARHAVRP